MIKNIFIIILTLGFIGSVIFLDVPMVQNVLGIKKDIETQQKLLSEKNDFIQTVEKLAEKYKGNEDVFKQLNFILPNDEDVPNLIVQLEALANGSGIILSDITFAKEEETEKELLDYKTISVDLRLSGSYESFKNFLATVENNMRLTDVDSINFQAKTDGGSSAPFDFDVILKTYYQIN